LRTLLGRLRRLTPAGDPESDAELLSRFAERGDQSAFELLVWRHGPLVLGVCRRILSQEQDAEDAFQAAFLVLARKAGSLARGAPRAGGRHRVAPRVARGPGAGRARRPEPQPDLEVAAPPAEDPLGQEELRGVLDEEIDRLPGRYREAVVHCYLGGLTLA